MKIDYEETFSFINLMVCAFAAKRNVNWKASVQRFGFSMMQNVYAQHSKLMAGNYKSRGICSFSRTERGKPREIGSNHIMDRFVLKCLTRFALTPALRPRLMYDNGATQKNKGCDFAIRRVKAHLERFAAAGNDVSRAYVVVMDFHSYFENVDRDLLVEKMGRYIEDERTLTLTDYMVKCSGKRGLVLGSEVSQIGAVFYRNDVDQFVKRRLRQKYYGAYMDDSYCICKTKEEATMVLRETIEKCKEAKIEINEKKTRICRLIDGFPYLKRRFLISKRGKAVSIPQKDSEKRMMAKLKKFAKWVAQGRMLPSEMEAGFNSWVSHFKHDDARTLTEKMKGKFDSLLSRYAINYVPIWRNAL